MELSVAWLAQGKIRVKTGDAAPRTVESRFGADIRERAVKAQQRNAWKTGGEGSKFLAGAMLWGKIGSRRHPCEHHQPVPGQRDRTNALQLGDR